MRRAARTDGNQQAITDALRAAGASVESLASVGHGVPDLLVSAHCINYLLEIKDGSKPTSKRALTDDERTWHAAWRGQVVVVASVEEALQAIGAT